MSATTHTIRTQIELAAKVGGLTTLPVAPPLDLLGAAEVILRGHAARAITLIATAKPMENNRNSTRLSPNDCYVALDEACRKMARVAVRKSKALGIETDHELAARITEIFPEPAAYLARAIKSVIADAGRVDRREVHTISLDQPLSGSRDSESPLAVLDTVSEDRSWKQPETSLLENNDKLQFRNAMNAALAKIPANYLAAIKRDILRDRERSAGLLVSAESANERQTIHRARTALAQILRKECGEDNPFIRLLSQQRSSRVRRETQKTPEWSGERQEALFRRLMQTGWSERVAERTDGTVDEAVVNEVSAATSIAPPSPEMRQAMRVLDLYTVDYPTPTSAAAREMYERGRQMRTAGNLEEALKYFKACFEAEPTFLEALNNVGNLYSQLGQLREALTVFLSIIEKDAPGDHKYIAATNAADIYLTWFDSGRNKERNIEQAIHYARIAMRRPTPMRASNLLLAYVKDRYFDDARNVLQTTVRENRPECPAEKFLQTVFQIRDKDLVSWWSWLDGEMEKE